MSISLFSDTYTDKPADQLHDIRYIGAICGCYSLSSREIVSDDQVKVFACRSQSISTKRIVVDAPVRGEVGELVCAKFEGFDIISGMISQLNPGGFVIDIMATKDECTKIAAKIDWVKKNKFRSFHDKRKHKRIMPPNPRTAITLSDGAVVECFVIDVSQSGVAVSADIFPEIGTRLAVGKAIGVVVRHLEVGFAIRFEETLDLDHLDAVFAWSLSYLNDGDGEAEAVESQEEPA